MAVIIRVHMATNAARPSPMVPVIPAIPWARTIVAAQAPAAAISRNATSRAARPGRGEASPGEPGPGERRGKAGLPLAPPVDAERRQARGPGRRDRQGRVRRVEHVRQLHRVVALDGDEVLDAEVDCTADPDMVAAAVL